MPVTVIGAAVNGANTKLPPSVYALGDGRVDAQDELSDERRLLRGTTRARREVVMTYQKTIGRAANRCRAGLSAKSGGLSRCRRRGGRGRGFCRPARRVVAPGKNPNASVRDKEFIKYVFDKNGFSVTALNNYLNCPWKYFYITCSAFRARRKTSKIRHRHPCRSEGFFDNRLSSSGISCG